MFMNVIFFILGANISFFLYACILAGKNSDERIYEEEKRIE